MEQDWYHKLKTIVKAIFLLWDKLISAGVHSPIGFRRVTIVKIAINTIMIIPPMFQTAHMGRKNTQST